MTSEVPFPGIDYRSQPVFNWSVGLHFQLSPVVSLRGGIYLGHSPVALETPVFRRVDVIGVRGGVSFHGVRLSGSVGLGWEHGRGNDDLFPSDVPIQGEKAGITLDTFSLIA
ncbi:MAG TPA: hypothetical protein VMH40_14255 [Myxococcaceae bacterium]|nr:hypothetical protein [Myxococcaceae bacterium]